MVLTPYDFLIYGLFCFPTWIHIILQTETSTTDKTKGVIKTVPTSLRGILQELIISGLQSIKRIQRTMPLVMTIFALTRVIILGIRDRSSMDSPQTRSSEIARRTVVDKIIREIMPTYIIIKSRREISGWS